MGSFEEGGGYLKTENLVELNAGNNVFAGKTVTDSLLSLSSLSSKDIYSTVVGLSNRIETQNASKEKKSVSEGADWLNETETENKNVTDRLKVIVSL